MEYVAKILEVPHENEPNKKIKKDLSQVSYEESIAREYLEEIKEIFSEFKRKAEELEVKEEIIHRISKELRLSL